MCSRYLLGCGTTRLAIFQDSLLVLVLADMFNLVIKIVLLASLGH